MEYKRICPECGCEIIYKYKSTRDNAEKHKTLCRNCGTYKRANNDRYGDLSILLNDTNESFYWIGFILADGSIQNNRLGFGLSIKDKDQVQKFANYIKYKKDIQIGYKELNNKIFGFCGLSVQDSRIVKQIKEKFDIRDNKTYNPPKTILKWDKNLLLSMFAGYIDGDGSIIQKTNRKDAKLGIQVHSSWLHILQEFNSLLNDKNYCGINHRGYAYLHIEEFPIIRQLKEELLKLNIPLLKRKWDKIDINYINRLEKGKTIRPLIKEDFKNGLSRKEICIKYKVSGALLTKILKYDK